MCVGRARSKLPSPAPSLKTKPPQNNRSYIAAGYVKWIESAGARAVPIRFYASDGELRRIFQSINGLVFPGGVSLFFLSAADARAKKSVVLPPQTNN